MSACAFGLVAASGLGGRTRARPERRWEREGEGEREGGESRPAAAPRRWRRGEERRGGAAAQGAWSDGREWTVEMDRDPERIRPVRCNHKGCMGLTSAPMQIIKFPNIGGVPYSLFFRVVFSPFDLISCQIVSG